MTDAEAESEAGGAIRLKFDGHREGREGQGEEEGEGLGEGEGMRDDGEVEEEATAEKRDPSKFSLVEAAQFGELQRCRELVENEGQDVTKGDNERITPLHWAAINNRIAVAR